MHHLDAQIVVAVCEGEVDYLDELTEAAKERLAQAVKLLKPMFSRWEKRIICSRSFANMATAEVLERAFNKQAHLYQDLFSRIGGDAMFADVDNINLRIDPKKVNLVVIPKFVFSEFVETYSLRTYHRLLEMEEEANGGDVCIFDNLEETRQEVHFELDNLKV